MLFGHFQFIRTLKGANMSELSLSEMLKDADKDFFARNNQLPRLVQIPYPQANSLDLVLKVVEVTRESGTSLYDLIKMELVKSVRQASYYYNAAAFLGFCYRQGDYFYPTERAAKLLSADEGRRASLFAVMALDSRQINELFVGVLQLNGRDKIMRWLTGKVTTKVRSPVTALRRAQSMFAWIKWIRKNIPEIKV